MVEWKILNMQRLWVILSVVLALGVSSGCKSTYLKAGDYQSSITALSSNSPAHALASFPSRETGRFITDMEKAYLNILQGKPEIDDLQRHALNIDNRMRYEVSESIKAFFYAQTPEGYYPSEHEIILAHLLLGWGYVMRDDNANALIEARRVGYLLSSPWSEEGHFDDPMLRILAASLWAMCGQWDDAAVDLRVAAQLDKTLQWAKDLADSKITQRHLVFVLGGVGPAACWDPEKNFNLLRGLRHVGFKPQGMRSDIRLMAPNNNNIMVVRSPDSSYWYERHWQRNNAIRDLVYDSQYGNTILLSSARHIGEVGVATVWGLTVGSLIFAGGAGIVYIGAEGGSGEAVIAGLTIMAAGPVYAWEQIGSTAVSSVEKLQKDLDVSDKYRFVRFLPEYVWVGWSNEELGESLRLTIRGDSEVEIRPFARSDNNVSLMFYPDTVQLGHN